MAVTQLAMSKNWVDVPVRSKDPDGYYYDPTHAQVVMAFIDKAVGGDPADTDFVSASWSGTPGMSGRAMASCLVGPGGAFAGQAGHIYQIFVKVLDDPEVPVLKSDTLTLT